ncbi:MULTISPECIES: PilZ domain-containing protein [Vibrio]|uniref:PilZ domain-containing protein n=1 Tax=Vibrio TaxID=662 RepID=UPI00142F2809|nr:MULTISPECIES: PilZ domain-containing protein [Vibrio]
MNSAPNPQSNPSIQLDSNHEATSPDVGSIIYGEDAFLHVSPLSEFAFNVATPTGNTLRCRSKFMGIHSKNLLVLEKPDVSPQDFALFFQRGYPIKACAISQKGEGARIYFKSKIEYVVQAGPHCIVFISLPTATQVKQGLRSEARLEITLSGILAPDKQKYLCEVRDISESGCQVVTDRAVNEYNVGNVIELKILDSDESEESPILTGVIKNKKLSSQYWKYGVQFDEKCLDQSKEITEKLSFDLSEHRFVL